MEKAVFNKSGMKQIINSGYKLFDNQTNLITTGNVIANTQYSSYVRGYNNIHNYDNSAKPGQLLKFDLQYFESIPPGTIKNILYDLNRTVSYILYEFCTWKGEQKNIIGYVLTDTDHNLIDYQVNHYYGENWIEKKFQAIKEAIKYICN